MTYKVQGMGWTLVVLGSLNISLGVAADAVFGTMDAWTVFHFISAPIWSGFFIVITGVLGIYSERKPTSRGLILAFLILGTLAIVFATVCFVMAMLGAFIDGRDCDYFHPPGSLNCASASTILHGVNAVLSLTEIVMGFVAAIMSYVRMSNMSNDVTSPLVCTQGSNTPPGYGIYYVMPTGVPYTTAGGGIPQQQVFYGTMAPPPYMPQLNTTAANTPAETKTQPPA